MLILNPRILFSAVALSMFSTHFVFAQTPTERIDSIRKKMEAAEDTLKELKSQGLVSFKGVEDEQEYSSALRKIQTSIDELKKLNQQLTVLAPEKEAELQLAINEAKTLKDLMMSYLAQNGIFGFCLVSDPVAIDINVDVGMKEIFRRISQHLNLGVRVDGRFQMNANSQDQRNAQFNKLKSAFFNALLNAAAIDSSNVQLNALANWGKDTNVATQRGRIDSTSIITFDEFLSLKLKK